jgi:hypothetical protein
VNATSVGVDGNRLVSRELNQRLFTRQVSRKQHWIIVHAAILLAIRQQGQIQPPDLG